MGVILVVVVLVLLVLVAAVFFAIVVYCLVCRKHQSSDPVPEYVLSLRDFLFRLHVCSLNSCGSNSMLYLLGYQYFFYTVRV